MKLSEAKAILAQAAGNNKEANAELTKLVIDLRQQIADLIAGNTDPEVTDAEFLQTINDLKATSQSLAEVVPNVPPELPPATV